MKIITIYLVFAYILSGYSSFAQDTLVAKDGTVLAGEIKEMDRGTVSMETSYSDDDFTITWLEVKQIVSSRSFRFTLDDGRRLYGTISKDTVANKLVIIDDKKGAVTIEPDQLVYLKQVDGGSVLDVINLSADFGYSLAKANNLSTFNGSLKADYIVNRWGVKGFYNVVRNKQDDADNTNRQEIEITGEMFFAHDFYAKTSGNWFINNAQNIKLRSSYSASIGKYFIHTNRIYLNTDIGIAYTIEDYIPDSITTRKSVEGKFSIEYNMFDIGDLSLFSKIDLFPSISEPGRLRTVFNFTTKYDLPRDFYIKGSIDYQYDTKPVEGIAPDDYVYTFGFGWEL
ncbi:MAG: DUF481 domain-containing protein [Bacteroidales bacterium]|nr:DUF481 domain-containing protein [Bacteroidales bacterium]